MNSPACPKYPACSAPLCPLDPHWRLRAHNAGDRVCLYLCESVKPGAGSRLDPAVLAACQAMVQAQADMPSAVRRILRHAATSGTRLEPPPGFHRKAGSKRAEVVTSHGNDREPILCTPGGR